MLLVKYFTINIEAKLKEGKGELSQIIFLPFDQSELILQRL